MKRLFIFDSIDEMEQKADTMPECSVAVIKNGDSTLAIIYKMTEDRLTVHKYCSDEYLPDNIVRYNDNTVVRYDNGDIVHADVRA